MFERTTPRIFEHGPTPATRLVVLAALALFLMVLDSRFPVVKPVRQAVATALYPLQWLMLQPVQLYRNASRYMNDLDVAQAEAAQAKAQMLLLAEKAHDASFLKVENEQLRALLDLRERVSVASLTAEVVYETPDPYTNRLTIDKGSLGGVVEGSAVLDSYGVLGQVARVYPMTSEVRLVSDRQHSVPVMNMRTGLRMVAFGEAVARPSGGMEVRYVPASADVQQGDALVTSGIDGVYPPGLPVGQVSFIETHHDAPFARIDVQPAAQLQRVRYVLILAPTGAAGQAGPEPQPEPLPQSGPEAASAAQSHGGAARSGRQPS